MKHLWLYLSSFGVMFAVLSWFQEANLIAPVSEMDWWKGLLAAAAGVPLYYFVARRSQQEEH